MDATGPQRRRELYALAAVLILAVAVRGGILFTGQRYLRSDEAVVGLMAKHIVMRGERPIFLYGQPYGGGHAIVAYLAAPLFACFGRSAILLTGISAAVSVVNVGLVWLIMRRYLGRNVALAGAAIYAFSPPVVYQAFLVNGGTESFFLALVALLFFLRAQLGGRPTTNLALAGLFAGLAYWGMDYALLYAVVFVLLWVISADRRKWRRLAVFAVGFLAGCLPVIIYDVRHDFVHMRHMFAPPLGPHVGFISHFAGALWDLVSGDLAAFFGGDIDDFTPVGPGAWIHAAAAVAAVAILIYEHRGTILERLKLRPFAEEGAKPLPAALLPVAFVLAYLVMYGAAKFSLPALRTPRYLLPLCPFVSMAIALAAIGSDGVRRRAAWRAVGVALAAFLVARGAIVSLQVGIRPWHEEHSIRTSGGEIVKLAEYLRSHGIRVAFAPYEIQWRLLFETDESVLVTSDGISPLPRHHWYGKRVRERVWKGHEKFAFLFRRDFAFAEWAAGSRRGGITRELWHKALRSAGLSAEGIAVGKEFVVFYPLTVDFLPHLGRAIGEER